jgi:hypothetical protein
MRAWLLCPALRRQVVRTRVPSPNLCAGAKDVCARFVEASWFNGHNYLDVGGM